MNQGYCQFRLRHKSPLRVLIWSVSLKGNNGRSFLTLHLPATVQRGAMIFTTKMKYIYSSGAEKRNKGGKKKRSKLLNSQRYHLLLSTVFSLQMILLTKVLLQISAAQVQRCWWCWWWRQHRPFSSRLVVTVKNVLTPETEILYSHFEKTTQSTETALFKTGDLKGSKIQ